MKLMPSKPGRKKRWFLMVLSIVLLFASMEQAQASSPSKPKKQKAAGMSWVKMHKQFPDSFILNGPRNAKQIALTFDDAPDPRFTPQILDILASYDVCATFFVVGSRAVKHPALVRRIHREGHTIGNHSYNHAVMSQLNSREFHTQIWRTDAIVSKIIGYHPRFVRPPYGEMLPDQVAWSRKSGYTVVNWDVDSVDWRNNPNSGIVLHNIKKTLQPGSIVLQHAGGGYGQDLTGTIQALPVLISQLRKKGYKFVTLPEMLNQPADKMK
ncbi:Peptidoglycan/xylan/chitin deacetylase, PgdA/CDA1 family [Paenibacillus catalpae]|uniref:Peptidoglycan/xylan/chitin deacetylase, PgdA/CDA1 family n=1 Tax=Paenibacillus catalpae TaxID=1045775 RepID=A0A1I1Y472_9BACL|nr:polysaccharide deacetylase family protein [Paenibacillus catalpae]SFE14475.1 Peptidoglycan/xylan/chitin deacetylase, PgdA/CDA1 family [Paenibacillus catalpae]